jgi:hypothetical protein
MPGNQKADPNLETTTYGLFSTCERLMRASIVNRGIEYIFFLTSRKGKGRWLTGFYRLGWYCKHSKGDFALAGSEQRFVFPSLGREDLPAELGEVVFSRFRASKRLNTDQTKLLLDLVSEREDVTGNYLQEIDRLERFNLRHTGFRHWGSVDPFDWNEAEDLLKVQTPLLAASSSSSTNNWKCQECKAVIFNRALLRRCPNCRKIGTLREIRRRRSSGKKGSR